MPDLSNQKFGLIVVFGLIKKSHYSVLLLKDILRASHDLNGLLSTVYFEAKSTSNNTMINASRKSLNIISNYSFKISLLLGSNKYRKEVFNLLDIIRSAQIAEVKIFINKDLFIIGEEYLLIQIILEISKNTNINQIKARKNVEKNKIIIDFFIDKYVFDDLSIFCLRKAVKIIDGDIFFSPMLGKETTMISIELRGKTNEP